MSSVVVPLRSVSWRALVLPREHGSWSLALEPLVLGLLVSPSAPGGALAAAALAIFFARRPWQAARAGDVRLRAAAVALATLGTLAAVALSFVWHHAPTSTLLALFAVAPAGLAFAWFDRRRAGRTVAAELCGASVFAGFAMAIVLAGGGDAPLGIAVGGFAAARSITSILAVRTFLRRRKGERVSAAPSILAACAAGIVFLAYGITAQVGWPAIWSGLFLARAIWLGGPAAPRWSARRLGMFEAMAGAAVVITSGVGW